MTKCKGCGKPIRWIKTVMGKNMPCDPELIVFNGKDDRRNLITKDGNVLSSYNKNSLLPFSGHGEGYMPHWSTCLKAKSFKKNQEGKTHGKTDKVHN